MRVSLIGHGRLGKLISSFLSRDVDLDIFDQSISRPISEISNSSVVLLCVPISQMEKVCQDISPHLQENTLIIDVCSVKEYPMEVMKKNLPSHAQILGTHPMFGQTVFTTRFLAPSLSCATKAVKKTFIKKLNSTFRIKECA